MLLPIGMMFLGTKADAGGQNGSKQRMRTCGGVARERRSLPFQWKGFIKLAWLPWTTVNMTKTKEVAYFRLKVSWAPLPVSLSRGNM